MKKYSTILENHSSDEDDVIMDTVGADRVCAVAFSAEGAIRGLHLLKELPLKDSHVREYRVHDKTMLTSIPRCEAYVIFVDYNQENVILEQDTAMQGILFLSTVRHLQSIKGSQVALVYFDDSGAISPSGHLYSDHVITQGHPVVADLCHRGRFLSVRYTWNSEQAASLNAWLPMAAMDKDRMALQIDSVLLSNIRYRCEKMAALVAVVLLACVVFALVLFLVLHYGP